MEVTADFIMDLPLSNGFDSILVVVDCFSKEVEFIPCNKTTTALDTARLYLIMRDLHMYVNGYAFNQHSPPHFTHKQMDKQRGWTEIFNSTFVSSQWKEITFRSDMVL